LGRAERLHKIRNFISIRSTTSLYVSLPNDQRRKLIDAQGHRSTKKQPDGQPLTNT
jgi:hypothetical protein